MVISKKKKIPIYAIVLMLGLMCFFAMPQAADAATQKTHTSVYSGDGGSSYAFTTSNGLTGACCQNGVMPGKNGKTLSMKRLSNTSKMARVAYIGQRDHWETSKGKYCVARALWMANGGSLYDCAANCQSTVKSINAKANKISKAPDWFAVYKCSPSGGGQDFVAWDKMYGKIRIKKTSSSPANTKSSAYSLTGTTFKVYNSSGTYVDTITVKANGYSEYTKSLLAGKYTLKETKAGTGYKKLTGSYSVTITGKVNETVTVTKTLSNTPETGSAKIVKTSETGMVSGFKFRVKNDNIGYNKVFTTDSKGVISASLYYGTYTVTEELTAAQKAAGYEQKGPWKFALNSSNKTATVNVKNTVKPSTVKIYKRSNTGEVLGFKFIVTESTGKSKTYVTQTTELVNGERLGVITTKLNPGTYRIEERLTDAQIKNWWVSETKEQTVKVEAGKTVRVTFENEKRPRHDPIRIYKTTTDGGSVEGFKFKVEGLHSNSIALMETELLQNADISVNVPETYSVGDWAADRDDLDKVNEAAKKGEVDKAYTVKLTNKAAAKITVPKNLTLTDITIGSVKVSWDAVKDATGYEVYRCEATVADEKLTEGEYTKLSDVASTDTSFTDTPDFTKQGYFYKVKALNGAVESGFSESKGLEKKEDVNTGNIGFEEVEGTAADKNPEDITLFASVSVMLVNVIKDADLNVSSKIEASDKEADTGQHSITYYHTLKYYGSATKFSAVGTTNRLGFIAHEKMEPGTYTVSEILTDQQKLRYKQPRSQTIELLEEGSTGTVIFENVAKTTPLKIIKKSPDGKVGGVGFTITGETTWGEVITPIDVVTTEEKAEDGSVYGLIDVILAPGEYTITEEVDENYYAPQMPQKIIVTGEENEKHEVTFVNKPYGDGAITKIASDTGKPLAGASLQLFHKGTDGSLNIVDEWVSKEEPYKITGLIHGETYVLHEESAPEGYVCAEDREFVAELGTAGDVLEIEMVDKPTTLLITKLADDTGKFLDGATFEIKDAKSGEVIVTFDIVREGNTVCAKIAETDTAIGDESITVSKNEQKSFWQRLFSAEKSKESGLASDESMYAKIHGLIEEKEYILSEIETPEGYTQIEDMTFTFLDGLTLEIENCRPKLSTNAWDAETKTQIAKADKTVSIVDTVDYGDTRFGKAYTLKAVIVDGKTGLPLKRDGKDVTAEKLFIAEGREGTVDVEFPTFDGSDLMGKKLVIFEYLYYDDKEVSYHADMKASEQTIYIEDSVGHVVMDDGNTFFGNIVMTGDNGKFWIAVLVLVLAAGGILLCRKRK